MHLPKYTNKYSVHSLLQITYITFLEYLISDIHSVLKYNIITIVVINTIAVKYIQLHDLLFEIKPGIFRKKVTIEKSATSTVNKTLFY